MVYSYVSPKHKTSVLFYANDDTDAKYICCEQKHKQADHLNLFEKWIVADNPGDFVCFVKDGILYRYGED